MAVALRKYFAHGIFLVLSITAGLAIARLWSNRGAAEQSTVGVVTGGPKVESRSTQTMQRPGSRRVSDGSAPGMRGHVSTTPVDATVRPKSAGASDLVDAAKPEPQNVVSLPEDKALVDESTSAPPESHYVIADVVEATCRHLGPGDYYCEKLHSDVAEFNEENRDGRWAQAREYELSEQVATLGGFEIRYLHCRQTLCVLEVYGPRGQTFTPLGWKKGPWQHLWEESSTPGFSVDEHGQPITVFVKTFSRIQQ